MRMMGFDGFGLPLHMAISRGSLPIVRLFANRWRRGLEVPHNHGRLALHQAVWNEASMETIQFLVEAGTPALEVSDDSGLRPVHLAAVKNLPLEVVYLLVRTRPEVLSLPIH